MTSNPASRSARATTFAPRSWPSRPGLATSTLSFLLMYILRAVHQQFRSERRRLFIGPKDLRHRRADLAERTAGAGGLENHRHRVVLCRADLGHRVEALPSP